MADLVDQAMTLQELHLRLALERAGIRQRPLSIPPPHLSAPETIQTPRGEEDE